MPMASVGVLGPRVKSGLTLRGSEEIHLVVMRGGRDHLHALAKEGAEARPRLHHRIPIGGLLVSAPVDAAEIVGDREMRGSGEVGQAQHGRSEEHTSELQSLMRTSYAVFCLKKKRKYKPTTTEY